MNRLALRLIPFSIIFLMGCAHTISPDVKSQQPASGELLKKACIKAAIRGIEAEITRYQDWIYLRKQNPADFHDLPDLEEGRKALTVDLKKYQSLDPKNYQLPGEIKTTAWVEGRPEANAILHVEGMSRSGPWYHLAGIKGDDYGVLKPDIKYMMTFYKVYPKSYFHMESSYIYIAGYLELE